MTTQAGKETIYKQDFEAFLETKEHPWLAQLRQKAFIFFEENGFPTTKNEEWKYTNIANLAKNDFQVLNTRLSSNLEERLDAHLVQKFDYKRNGFTALNTALGEFFCLRIPMNTKIEEPIFLETVTEAGKVNFPHILIFAEAGSKATIVESYSSSGKSLTNTAVQIFFEPNAHLTHYRIQKESPEAFHIGTTEVTLGRGSLYNATNINLGGQISRHDIHLKFTAEGGEAFVDGLYMLNGNQHHDTHSTIDHALPNCVSHQTYKGVLNDKSRGVFNGKVFVRENASGTDAQQSNKNLLLSNDARVDTKPQLEIFNDDVKCAHGATVGQLEDEELFYLLSRGISQTLAKNLLTYGFAEEIINKIGIEEIKKDLDEAVLNRLDVNLEA